MQRVPVLHGLEQSLIGLGLLSLTPPPHVLLYSSESGGRSGEQWLELSIQSQLPPLHIETAIAKHCPHQAGWGD